VEIGLGGRARARRGAWITVLALGGALGPSASVATQEPHPAARDAFLADAARAAARYSDRGEAHADGFRRLGPDFPGMGTHWVQTRRIVSGVLDGDRPAVLCYADIGGELRLVGLAYTLPLAPDESPPAEPLGLDVWHDHSGEVSEESLLLSHPSSISAPEPGFRLSMVHVWLPLTNPDGIFAQNNWRLPFLRAGLEVPSRLSSEAARGVSLATSGIEYYRELLRWAVPEADDSEVIEAILRRRAGEAEALVGSKRVLSPADLSALAETWRGLWADLERSLAPAIYVRIAPLGSGHG
jgi:hypothetical protein